MARMTKLQESLCEHRDTVLPDAVTMRHFTNPWPHEAHGIPDILRWKLRIGPRELPELPQAPDEPARVKILRKEEIATPPEEGWRVTWLGHASFLLQGAAVSILIDPVFSDYCAPLPIPSLRRRAALPCGIDDLPKIDAILLTHGHYDHLDLTSLRRLGKRTRMITAEGHSAWLGRKGFTDRSELPWHASMEITAGVRVTATPAQHFNARSVSDRNRAHWCGFLIEGADCKLWHAGDSGWCPAFAEIGVRYGPIDFGMIPIGAYLPRRIMRAMHMNPDEAARAFVESGCRRAVAMHWGTFKLTDEPMGEPPLLLEKALRERGIPSRQFEVSEIGTQWQVLSQRCL